VTPPGADDQDTHDSQNLSVMLAVLTSAEARPPPDAKEEGVSAGPGRCGDASPAARPAAWSGVRWRPRQWVSRSGRLVPPWAPACPPHRDLSRYRDQRCQRHLLVNALNIIDMCAMLSHIEICRSEGGDDGDHL